MKLLCLSAVIFISMFKLNDSVQCPLILLLSVVSLCNCDELNLVSQILGDQGPTTAFNSRLLENKLYS